LFLLRPIFTYFQAISYVTTIICRAYPHIEDQFRELGYQRVFEEKMQTEATNQKKIGHLVQLGSIIGKF
jgi:hypothetical protein